MSDKKAKVKKKILELLEAFDWIFAVQNYSRTIHFHKEDHEKEGVAATILYIEEYSQIVIDVYPYFFELDAADQRKALLHELCHKITVPSKKLAMKLLDGKLVTPDEIQMINERTTSHIENILDKLLKGGLKFSRDAYKKYLD